jgi:hypothetical protein
VDLSTLVQGFLQAIDLVLVMGIILFVAALVCTIDGGLTLRHMEINPTYMLIQHFAGSVK